MLLMALRKFPHPEEPAERASRRTHCTNPADHCFSQWSRTAEERDWGASRGRVRVDWRRFASRQCESDYGGPMMVADPDVADAIAVKSSATRPLRPASRLAVMTWWPIRSRDSRQSTHSSRKTLILPCRGADPSPLPESR